MSLLSKVKVRVHKAHFVEISESASGMKNSVPTEYYFINVQNKYKRQAIVLANIFLFSEIAFDTAMKLDLAIVARPLPVIIQPQSEWEVWISCKKADDFISSNMISNLRPSASVYTHVLARLGNDRYIPSKTRKNVKPSGEVPGGKLEIEILQGE